MDVMPVFTNSCDFSGCHLMPSGTLLVYLGELGNANMPPPYSFARMVYDAIVDKPSIEAPTMMFVKPSDPTNSYLLRKLDNALSDIMCAPDNALEKTFSSTTMSTPCGIYMPTTSITILDASERDVIREWIAQGAQFN